MPTINRAAYPYETPRGYVLRTRVRYPRSRVLSGSDSRRAPCVFCQLDTSELILLGENTEMELAACSFPAHAACWSAARVSAAMND